jgi:hypothetical protein
MVGKNWESIPEGEKRKRKSLVLLALDKTSSIPKYVWKQYHRSGLGSRATPSILEVEVFS